jgi:murein DD-endopeptidase MepM/ murein hydrolase activator NlpD
VGACNKYRLPIPKDLLQRIDKTSSPAHVGKLRNAIDLIVPQNTPVLAAADGIVTFVKDDSNVGGPDPSYWIYANLSQLCILMESTRDMIIWNMVSRW